MLLENSYPLKCDTWYKHERNSHLLFIDCKNNCNAELIAFSVFGNDLGCVLGDFILSVIPV